MPSPRTPRSAQRWQTRRVERLYPLPAGTIDAAQAAGSTRASHAERPWVMLNMVASIDGAAAIDGLSGGLSSEPDKAMFGALRAQARHHLGWRGHRKCRAVPPSAAVWGPHRGGQRFTERRPRAAAVQPATGSDGDAAAPGGDHCGSGSRSRGAAGWARRTRTHRRGVCGPRGVAAALGLARGRASCCARAVRR